MAAGHLVIELDTVDSTNSYIREHPETWDRPFCAVVAREQTAGRGRHGCRWHSSPGLDLTFSLLFLPETPPAWLPCVTILAGLAVRRALLPRLGDRLKLKWPNDLLHDGKKIGGILCELFDAGSRPGVIVGIGINVNSSVFPEGLGGATSMKIATGNRHDTGELLGEILEVLRGILSRFQVPLDGTLIGEWEAATSSIGERVRYRGPEGTAEGVIAGIDPRGFLLVRDGSNGTVVPWGGEIQFMDE